MSPEEAFGVVRDAIRRDKQCAENWHVNVACSATAEGVDQATANRIAANFMWRYFGGVTSGQ